MMLEFYQTMISQNTSASGVGGGPIQIHDTTSGAPPGATAGSEGDSANTKIYLDGVKREGGCEWCSGCGRAIQDRFILRVGDSSYHETCLACCACGIPLHHTCFTRSDKIYCKTDYERIYGAKCSRCGDRLLPQELVMRAQHHVYHLPCFSCFICRQPLQKGEQFVLRAGKLFCRQDFENEMFLLQHPDDDLIIDETGRPRDGRRGPKRPRTILTSAQRRQFKASFEVSPKPCRKVREALAKDTGLSVRVVQVWFQNQRAKMKKIQRKAKQDGDKHSSSSSSSDKDKEKEDKSIKQESPSSEHYLGIDSSFSSSSQPLNPNMPYSPDVYHGNSNDSFCSSDISLDGSNFDQLDEGTSDTISLQNLDLHHHQGQGQGHHHHHHNHPGSLHEHTMTALAASVSLINPIDKLYLMQNSYFSTDR